MSESAEFFPEDMSDSCSSSWMSVEMGEVEVGEEERGMFASAVGAPIAPPLVSGLSHALVDSVQAEDAESIATVESQWLLVEAEDGDEADDTSSESSIVVADPIADSVAAAGSCTGGISSGFASARLLATDQLQLGFAHNAERMMSECPGYRCDATAQWAQALEAFPAVTSAFCLGRLAVSAVAASAASLKTAEPPTLIARVAIQNIGRNAWPDGTALRIVAGDPYGFDVLPVGGVPPGHGAELALDLRIAASNCVAGCGQRSGWVLTDHCGSPFGPLLVLEVFWY
eukprot:TRINITY_DN18864_c0_g1_i1.p1 TRINITY_DN18864_c0_g1~~TRINITY_DN18864_c0_g1_i1.p1  ORF type:complete len:286 (-),score=60.06 TRINITY_DN18864_c0_g1_i1:142-999(-)